MQQRMKMSFLEKKAERLTSRPEQEASSKTVRDQNDRDLAMFDMNAFDEFGDYMTDYGNDLANTWKNWEGVKMPNFKHCFSGQATANAKEPGTCDVDMGDFECGYVSCGILLLHFFSFFLINNTILHSYSFCSKDVTV